MTEVVFETLKSGVCVCKKFLSNDLDGKTLRKFVNKRLVALKKDGTLKKLSQKYFGGDFVSDLK